MRLGSRPTGWTGEGLQMMELLGQKGPLVFGLGRRMERKTSVDASHCLRKHWVLLPIRQKNSRSMLQFLIVQILPKSFTTTFSNSVPLPLLLEIQSCPSFPTVPIPLDLRC